jgi:hypothetical protein
MNWLNELQFKSRRVYSQYGQDGLIEFIFKNIGTTNKFCVEFGFNSCFIDGGSGANTARLILEDGWKSLLLDENNENLSINLHREPLSFENIGSVFKKYEIPQNPDYVSIDVDSIDLWLFKGMLFSGYRPRLISVEYNSNFPITISATVRAGTTWQNDAVYGASLLALNKLAEEFEYHLICVEKPLDTFFVRNDLVHDRINLLEFAKFTGIVSHQPPTQARSKLFVQYPSLEPLVQTPWDHLF